MEKIKKVSTKMTYYIVYEVFVRELDLRGSELNVFSAIYSAVAHMNGYISISQICRQTGSSRSRVCDAINKLECRGLITRSTEGRRRKNKYSLIGVEVGARGIPKIGLVQEMTSPQMGHTQYGTEQYYCDFRTSTSPKILLPIVNNL